MGRNEVIESAVGTIPAAIFALGNKSPDCRSAINGYHFIAIALLLIVVYKYAAFGGSLESVSMNRPCLILYRVHTSNVACATLRQARETKRLCLSNMMI